MDWKITGINPNDVHPSNNPTMENSLEKLKKEIDAFFSGETAFKIVESFIDRAHSLGLQEGRKEAVEYVRSQIPEVHGEAVHKQELEEILKEASPERREG